MGHASHPPTLCARFHRASELIGRRWTGAIIFVLLKSRCRFAALRGAIPDITDRMLTDRIDQLDLVITDYLMPSMTGEELIGRLRERHPHVKALIVTGHGDILDQEAPEFWMREAHLTKPFDVTTLKHAIANLIGPAS